DLLPTAVNEIDDDDLPQVLARSIALVSQRAKAQVPHLDFTPVLTTSYADGARMLTATCVVSDVGSGEQFPNSAYKRWEFASAEWDEIHYISVPVLSTKERYKLDINLKKTAKKMLRALKFLPAEDELLSLDAVSSYRKFHRFYPAFR